MLESGQHTVRKIHPELDLPFVELPTLEKSHLPLVRLEDAIGREHGLCVLSLARAQIHQSPSGRLLNYGSGLAVDAGHGGGARRAPRNNGKLTSAVGCATRAT